MTTRLVHSLIPARVHGVPDCEWRVHQVAGRSYIERRALPNGPWLQQSEAMVRGEVAHLTEAGVWIRNLQDSGQLTGLVFLAFNN